MNLWTKTVLAMICAGNTSGWIYIFWFQHLISSNHTIHVYRHMGKHEANEGHKMIRFSIEAKSRKYLYYDP